MSEPRLTSDMQISALRRFTEAGGDVATVIRKGDPTSGAILLIGLIRGHNPVLFERFSSLDGDPRWQAVTADSADNDSDVSAYWKKRVARDPDLWVIELDVASPERLNGLLTFGS